MRGLRRLDQTARRDGRRRAGRGPALSTGGGRWWSWKRPPTADMSRQMSTTRCCRRPTTWVTTFSRCWPASMAAMAASMGSGSKARSTTACDAARPCWRRPGRWCPRRCRPRPAMSWVVAISPCSSSRRQGGVDDHRPPLAGRQRRRPPAARHLVEGGPGSGHGCQDTMSEPSLIGHFFHGRTVQDALGCPAQEEWHDSENPGGRSWPGIEGWHS